jgi:SPP1 gp7 family putative phage head morphogenesis protein
VVTFAVIFLIALWIVVSALSDRRSRSRPRTGIRIESAAGRKGRRRAYPKAPNSPQTHGDEDDNSDDIRIEPELTPRMRATITKMLTESLLQGGTDIPAEKIPALQQRIQDSTFSGDRADRLAKILQAEFGLARHVAVRVAAYASSLVMSKYHELHARECDCTHYRWSSCNDAMVCPRCMDLDGKVFAWDNPPDGGNPGECECWRLICAEYAKTPVGRLDSRCPSCEAELPKRPRAKAKCKSCHQEIWVGKNAEGQQILLSEEMLPDYYRQKDGPEICRCRAVPIIPMPTASLL